MPTEKIHDAFAPGIEFVVEEASGEVDGKHILAKVRGEFFFPGGTSRNKRYYPESLWSKQLAKPALQERIESRRMYGTISHEQEIDDKALLDGKLSHIVTGLKIDGKKGIGEALILNTDAGRILNTCLRAKSKMFVSSRATGGFKGNHNGVPVVDEDSYDLRTFDFVLEPGFLQASPGLSESLQQEDLDTVFGVGTLVLEKDVLGSLKDEASDPPAPKPNEDKLTPPNDGGRNMPPPENTNTNPLAEKLMTEKVGLENQLGEAVDVTKKLEKTIATLEQKLDGKVDEIRIAKEEIKDLKEQTKTAMGIEADLKELGSISEIKKALVASRENNEELKDLAGGDMKKVKEMLAYSKECMERFGGLDELGKAIKLAKDFADSVKDLGTVEELRQVVEMAPQLADEFRSSINENRVQKLLDVTRADPVTLAGMVNKGMTDEEIISVYKDAGASSRLSERYRKRDDNNNNNNNDDGHSRKASAFDPKDRGKRLMQESSGITRAHSRR